MNDNWKPGDVAMIRTYGRAEVVAMRGVDSWSFASPLPPGGFTTNYDRSEEITPLRRLVVIDPEDTEQIERLEALMAAHNGWTLLHNAPRVGYLQAALREFANPTPPKPEEPTGLGAVVEDARGRKWVRITANGTKDCWKPNDSRGLRAYWADVEAVRILAEGVTP